MWRYLAFAQIPASGEGSLLLQVVPRECAEGDLDTAARELADGSDRAQPETQMAMTEAQPERERAQMAATTSTARESAKVQEAKAIN